MLFRLLASLAASTSLLLATPAFANHDTQELDFAYHAASRMCQAVIDGENIPEMTLIALSTGYIKKVPQSELELVTKFYLVTANNTEFVCPEQYKVIDKQFSDAGYPLDGNYD